MGILFLLLQCGSVVNRRFVSSQWLAWTPNDYAVWYRLQVHLDGRDLSPAEIARRYGLAAEQVYENPARNIMDMVQQRERTYDRGDHAEVLLVYRPNGESPQEWRGRRNETIQSVASQSAMLRRNGPHDRCAKHAFDDCDFNGTRHAQRHFGGSRGHVYPARRQLRGQPTQIGGDQSGRPKGLANGNSRAPTLMGLWSKT